MLKIKEAVIVEGKYDKVKVSKLFDTLVITTNGFRIFSDKDKLHMMKDVAKKFGVIILTDSDGAGFVIRNYLKAILPKDKVKHAYIPQIQGKEKRKELVSKENLLGVEAVPDDVIISSIQQALPEKVEVKKGNISKYDLLCDGFYGCKNSKEKRSLLLEELGLPKYINSNDLLKYINFMFSEIEYRLLVEKLK